MSLKDWGWCAFFQEQITDAQEVVARVTEEHKQRYRLQSEQGEILGECSGKFLHQAAARIDYPTVGDWVLVEPRWQQKSCTIKALLRRRSLLVRKGVAEDGELQPIAANVDTVFILSSLNQELNIRRLERYLTMVWESGAQPVVLLTKADLVDDLAASLHTVSELTLGAPVHVISTFTKYGMEQLAPYFGAEKSIAFVGSSGVGKSSLLNYLVGDTLQKVQEIRAGDDKGKHTTSYRKMFLLPNGAVVVDTPGLRELQLSGEHDEALANTFTDLEELARSCKFHNCEHKSEPACAVKNAIAAGQISSERLESYQKLMKELAFRERKNNKKYSRHTKKKD